MPIPQTQINLKSYFETSDTPTQAQFAELIDTMFYLFNDAKATAQSAVDTANSAVTTAQSLSPHISVLFSFNISGTIQITILSGASFLNGSPVYLSPGGGGSLVRLNFLVPFANTNYKPILPFGTSVYDKQPNYLTISISSISLPATLPIVIFS